MVKERKARKVEEEKLKKAIEEAKNREEEETRKREDEELKCREAERRGQELEAQIKNLVQFHPIFIGLHLLSEFPVGHFELFHIFSKR